MAAVHSARRWPLPALRWLSTAYVAVLPHRLPNATGRSGIQRPPWLARATVATIAPPAVATAAAGRGNRRSGTQRPAPSAEVQALLDQYGIDVQKVVRRYPHVAKYDVQRVERMVSYLAGLELDVKHMVEKDPAILAGQVEAYEAVIQLLRRNGVNISYMVSSNPTVFHRRVTTLQLIIDAIIGSGHSPADVLRRYPSLLRSSAVNVSSTLQIMQRPPDKSTSSVSDSLQTEDPKGMLLRSLGLDADTLLRKAPQSLVLTYNKLNATVVYLESLGVDVPKTVRLAPRVLGRPPEALQQRTQFLSENGLDVLRHVKGCPTLFYFSVERKMRPTLTFVLEEMGRSTADLDGTPSIWCYDLQGRLRPRFLFLKSLGKAPTSLHRFAAFSDQRFATIVAGTDLQRYYDWRRQNGYSVPLGTAATPAATSGRVRAVPPLVSGSSNNKQNELEDNVH